MRLSEAGLEANIDYWKRVAERYRTQRDLALDQVQILQKELLRTTGKAYDGLDYLREIKRTKAEQKFFTRIISFIRRSS